MSKQQPRDWWVVFGMAVTACAAAVSSFSGLRSLAAATGWPEALAPLLPFTIDAYAMTATRVWVSKVTGSATARRFARWNAIGAIGLSLIGNAAWHLMAAHVLAVTWPIVVLVGAVPPAVLGLLSHLAVLRGQDEEDEPAPVSTEPDQPQDEDGQDDAADSSDQLLEAARTAEAAYRAERGKPITRDELRRTLRVSTERATVLLQRIKRLNEMTSEK